MCDVFLIFFSSARLARGQPVDTAYMANELRRTGITKDEAHAREMAAQFDLLRATNKVSWVLLIFDFVSDFSLGRKCV